VRVTPLPRPAGTGTEIHVPVKDIIRPARINIPVASSKDSVQEKENVDVQVVVGDRSFDGEPGGPGHSPRPQTPPPPPPNQDHQHTDTKHSNGEDEDLDVNVQAAVVAEDAGDDGDDDVVDDIVDDIAADKDTKHEDEEAKQQPEYYHENQVEETKQPEYYHEIDSTQDDSSPALAMTMDPMNKTKHSDARTATGTGTSSANMEKMNEELQFQVAPSLDHSSSSHVVYRVETKRGDRSLGICFRRYSEFYNFHVSKVDTSLFFSSWTCGNASCVFPRRRSKMFVNHFDPDFMRARAASFQKYMSQLQDEGIRRKTALLEFLELSEKDIIPPAQ